MIENDIRRYDIAPQVNNSKYGIWDYYDNTYVAYCDEEEYANKIIEALNKVSDVVWSEENKHWMPRKDIF